MTTPPPVLPRAFLDRCLSPLVPVGSRETCNPPPTDTDADFLVLSPYAWGMVTDLVADGWELGGSEDPNWEPGAFLTFRKGIYNLIVIHDRKHHAQFLAATSLAKRLNVLDKSDRIALFETVRRDYGMYEPFTSAEELLG